MINKSKKSGVSLQGEYFKRWLLALGVLGGRDPSVAPHVSKNVAG